MAVDALDTPCLAVQLGNAGAELEEASIKGNPKREELVKAGRCTCSYVATMEGASLLPLVLPQEDEEH